MSAGFRVNEAHTVWSKARSAKGCGHRGVLGFCRAWLDYGTYQTVHGSLVRLLGLLEVALEDILIGLLRATASRGGSGSGSGLGGHCVDKM